MATNSRRERAEQSGSRTMPGGLPGQPETPDAASPPNKPGQYERESDQVARDAVVSPREPARAGRTAAEQPRLVPGEAPKAPRQSDKAEGD